MDALLPEARDLLNAPLLCKNCPVLYELHCKAVDSVLNSSETKVQGYEGMFLAKCEC